MIPFVFNRPKIRDNRSSNTFFVQLKQLVTAICVAFILIYLTSSSPSSENRLIVNTDEEISNYVAPSLPGCKPPQKIAFVKTMRGATSTSINMLLQYAKKNNLVRQEMVEIKPLRSGPFNRTIHLVDPAIKGDIMADQFIWNRDEVVAHMGSEVVSLTIIRDPYETFESFYSYYNLTKENEMDIKTFIKLLQKSSTKDWDEGAITADQIGLGFYQYGLALSFGLPILSLNNEAAVDKLLERLDKELDFVMIADRMEESLVLFRYLMCLNPEDIVTFDQNVRNREMVVKLDDEDRKELKRWLKADEKIYNHFYKIFEDKVAKYPGNMKLEIQQRIRAREELRADCILTYKNNTNCVGFNTLEAISRHNRI